MGFRLIFGDGEGLRVAERHHLHIMKSVEVLKQLILGIENGEHLGTCILVVSDFCNPVIHGAFLVVHGEWGDDNAAGVIQKLKFAVTLVASASSTPHAVATAWRPSARFSALALISTGFSRLTA